MGGKDAATLAAIRPDIVGIEAEIAASITRKFRIDPNLITVKQLKRRSIVAVGADPIAFMAGIVRHQAAEAIRHRLKRSVLMI
jgi:hypothetical protein